MRTGEHRRWVAAIALAAASCSKPLETPEGPVLPVATVRESPRSEMLHPKRPTLVEVVPIEYLELPTIEEPKRSRGKPLPISILATTWGRSLLIEGDRAGTLELDRVRVYTADPTRPPLVTPWVTSELIASRSSRDQPCAARSTTGSLTVIEGDPTAPSHLRYGEYQARFAKGSCESVATEVRSVSAPAVVPGALYAYRSISPTSEELVLIAPIARWLASSTDPKAHETSARGAFSRIVLPVVRGSSASTLMDIDGAALARHLAAHGSSLPVWVDQAAARSSVLELSVEIVWAEATDQPQAFVNISEVTPDAARLTRP